MCDLSDTQLLIVVYKFIHTTKYSCLHLKVLWTLGKVLIIHLTDGKHDHYHLSLSFNNLPTTLWLSSLTAKQFGKSMHSLHHFYKKETFWWQYWECFPCKRDPMNWGSTWWEMTKHHCLHSPPPPPPSSHLHPPPPLLTPLQQVSHLTCSADTSFPFSVLMNVLVCSCADQPFEGSSVWPFLPPALAKQHTIINI